MKYEIIKTIFMIFLTIGVALSAFFLFMLVGSYFSMHEINRVKCQPTLEQCVQCKLEEE